MARKTPKCLEKVVAVIGEVTDDDPNDFYPFSNKHLVFLEEFVKDFDPERAAQEAGYKNPKQAAVALMRNPNIRGQCEKFYNAAMKAIEMDAKTTAARHLAFMDKIEQDYDSIDEPEKKSGLASAFAKMSGDSLKASGMFSNNGDKQAVNVILNVGFSSEKGIVIDGKKQD